MKLKPNPRKTKNKTAPTWARAELGASRAVQAAATQTEVPLTFAANIISRIALR
jgi:hypothetical protein